MKVVVSWHALDYALGNRFARTDLWNGEILKIYEMEAFVRFGFHEGTSFDVAWDWHKEEPIIFVVNEREDGTIVISSIWQISFYLPVDPPTGEQIEEARKKVALLRPGI